MTLHDRIMAINVQSDRKRADVRAEAASLAKEADELMALLAEDLSDQCTNPNDYTDSLLSRYNTYMESKQ